MSDLPNWITALAALVALILSIVGAPLAAYLAASRVMVKLETKMEFVLNAQTLSAATLSRVEQMVQAHELKLEQRLADLARVEGRLKEVGENAHAAINTVTPFSIYLQMCCEKLDLPWVEVTRPKK